MTHLTTNGVEQKVLVLLSVRQLLKADTNWKQTSYNGNMRVRYAGIGYSYNSGSLDFTLFLLNPMHHGHNGTP